MIIKGKRITALTIILCIVGLFVVLVLPNFLNSYIQQVFIQIVMYAYLASSWNILGGFAGQFSLGHAIYIGLGAYTSTILYLYLGVSPWIGALIGGLLAACIAAMIGYPCFKLRSTYYALTSVALGNVFMLLFQSVQKVGSVELGAAKGIRITPVQGNNFVAFQFRDKMYYYYIIVAMLIMILLVCNWIKKSKMGYQLASIANNQEAAEALGVNSRMLKVKAAAISAFFCALGGTFYAQNVLVCNPATLFGEAMSDELVIVSMIGGKGTLFGPAVGAAIVRTLSQLTTAIIGSNIPGLHLAIYGIMLVVCIRFFPDGVLALIEKLIAKIKSKQGEKSKEEA